MSATTRLFISDLHLCEPHDRAFRGFTALLADAGRFDEIYLLGDVCEVWVGDDDDGPLARELVSALAAAAEHSRVYVMAGNRDFLFGDRFEREAGVRLISDPCLLDDGVLLAHGDAMCIDDIEYQQTRRVLRSQEWQQDILARPLTERRALAEGMRAQSRATSANKAENIMDVSPAEVSRLMSEHQARVLVHGHTHRPAVHREPWGRRYTLGAWERCGWRVEQHAATFRLLCFALPGPATADGGS